MLDDSICIGYVAKVHGFNGSFSIKLDGTSTIHSSMLLPLMLMLLVLLLYCALILLMKYKTEIIRIKKKNIRRI